MSKQDPNVKMWQCPRCQRLFKNTNQSHYCGKKPSTIDEYIEMQDHEIRPFLIQLRTALQEAMPNAQERISWSMPTYWQQHNLVQFAAHQHHLGFYAGPKAVLYFADELKDYPTSKGTVRFSYEHPLPLALIKRIAQWCCETGNHV